jgi:hypothetical protein
LEEKQVGREIILSAYLPCQSLKDEDGPVRRSHFDEDGSFRTPDPESTTISNILFILFLTPMFIGVNSRNPDVHRDRILKRTFTEK